MIKELCRLCKTNEPDIAFSFNGPKLCCYTCWEDESKNPDKAKYFGLIPMRFMTKEQLQERYPKNELP